MKWKLQGRITRSLMRIEGDHQLRGFFGADLSLRSWMIRDRIALEIEPDLRGLQISDAIVDQIGVAR